MYYCFIILITDFGYTRLTENRNKRKSFAKQRSSKSFVRETLKKYLSLALLFLRKTPQNHP